MKIFNTHGGKKKNIEM